MADQPQPLCLSGTVPPNLSATEYQLTLLQIGLYRYVGIMNILTDIALVVLPIPMMWKIQISWKNKAFILGLFAVRLMFVVMSHCFLEPVSDQKQCTRGHSYPTRLPLPLLQFSQ